MKTLKSAKPERTEKVTKYEIDIRKEKEEAERIQKGLLKSSRVLFFKCYHKKNPFNFSIAAQKAAEPEEPEIEINPNRVEVEGAVARNVTEAITILKYVIFLFTIFNE